MTQENVRLELLQNNDETVQLTVTDPNNAGRPFDLSPAAISVVLLIKPTADTVDTDPAVVTYNATKTDPVNGVCQVTVPAAFTATVGRRWWRADVLSSAPVSRRTAAFGPQETVAV